MSIYALIVAAPMHGSCRATPCMYMRAVASCKLLCLQAAISLKWHSCGQGCIVEWEGTKKNHFHCFSVVDRSGLSLMRMSTSDANDAAVWVQVCLILDSMHDPGQFVCTQIHHHTLTCHLHGRSQGTVYADMATGLSSAHSFLKPASAEWGWAWCMILLSLMLSTHACGALSFLRREKTVFMTLWRVVMQALVNAGCERRMLADAFRKKSPLRGADVRWVSTRSNSYQQRIAWSSL